MNVQSNIGTIFLDLLCDKRITFRQNNEPRAFFRLSITNWPSPWKTTDKRDARLCNYIEIRWCRLYWL